jgi:hypothetical protein
MTIINDLINWMPVEIWGALGAIVIAYIICKCASLRG